MQRVFKNGNRCLYISQALASESDKDFNPRDHQNMNIIMVEKGKFD